MAEAELGPRLLSRVLGAVARAFWKEGQNLRVVGGRGKRAQWWAGSVRCGRGTEGAAQGGFAVPGRFVGYVGSALSRERNTGNDTCFICTVKTFLTYVYTPVKPSLESG